VLLGYFLGINVLLLLFGGAVLYGLLRLLISRWRGGPSVNSIAFPFLLADRSASLGPLLSRLRTGAIAAAAPVSLGLVFLTFLKLGSVVYGSGYTLLAFLRADLVQQLHWLTDKQLLDAVSIGQFTPGPVFTTATFIGYLIGGWKAALLATLATALPDAMARVDPASVALDYRDRMIAVASAVMPGRVGVSIDGFAGRFAPAPLGHALV